MVSRPYCKCSVIVLNTTFSQQFLSSMSLPGQVQWHFLWKRAVTASTFWALLHKAAEGTEHPGCAQEGGAWFAENLKTGINWHLLAHCTGNFTTLTPPCKSPFMAASPWSNTSFAKVHDRDCLWALFYMEKEDKWEDEALSPRVQVYLQTKDREGHSHLPDCWYLFASPSKTEAQKTSDLLIHYKFFDNFPSEWGRPPLPHDWPLWSQWPLFPIARQSGKPTSGLL